MHVSNDQDSFILVLFKHYKTKWEIKEIKDTKSFKKTGLIYRCDAKLFLLV